jgi:hypothetical protein
MWLIIRNIYLKYEVDPFRNKEVTVKINIFKKTSKLNGDKSKNIMKVMNLVTFDMVDDN